MQGNPTSASCTRGDRHSARTGRRWARWIFPVTGLLALLWFLIRVVPKPSRAMYPCQRVAMPMASGFVAWLMALAGSAAIFRRTGLLRSNSRIVLACLALAGTAVVGVVSLAGLPGSRVTAEGPWGPHGPMGQAEGIHPGRVVWVYDPEATDWDGYRSPRHWWQDECTSQGIVEGMLSQAVRGVAGLDSDAAAWDAIFRYFNKGQDRGDVGYRPGEKIAVKLNLTTCASMWGNVDALTYNKSPGVMNTIDNSPQMVLALLRQLVNTVGVDQNDITIGDPTGMVPNYCWQMLHPEFPQVHYLDNYGGSGRTRAEFSNIPLYWSTRQALGKRQDYIPTAFAEADYIINFAILKGHSSGVTLCAKNHYGSLIRTPHGYLRPELPGLPTQAKFQGYYDMHLSLPNAGWSPGTAHYRALVDLMGHPELGGKTLLYLIDGLFGGYYANARPYQWNMWPFNGDWPSSVFASQDPVAIDSVGYDFVNTEWPDVVRYGHAPGPAYDLQGGAEDYLHEAALANDPCSGTFYDPDHAGNVRRLESLGVHEHWNNPIEKRYAGNLKPGTGIELILLPSEAVAGDIDSDGDVDTHDLRALSDRWLTCAEAGNANTEPGADCPASFKDFALLARNWRRVTSQQSPERRRP